MVSKNTQPDALSVYPPVLGRTGGSQLLRLTVYVNQNP